MIALFTGLLAGFIHVWSGPDHLSALAPLAVKTRKNSWIAGLKWGLGHSIGVILVGGLALIFRDFIPVNVISGWGEQFVGVMLIGIGVWGLHKAYTKKVHIHSHQHDGEVHTHIHLHQQKTEHEKPYSHIHMHAAMGIGVLHGLAGSSHFLGVLPALAFSTTFESTLYIIAFGIGTIISMILFASSVGILSNKFAIKNNMSYKWLMSVCSFFAVAVGIFWLI